jgi:hypothetical protein
MTQRGLDAIAKDYVHLQLALGTHDQDPVRYFGPPQWRADAEAHPQPITALQDNAMRLLGELQRIDVESLDTMSRRRHAFLVAHVRAAKYRLGMLEGVYGRFEEEAEQLYAVVPKLRPLSSYDVVLERVDALLPGSGPLTQRVQAFRDRLVIPADRLDEVMRTAIAECERRTLAHIALPASNSFSLELVRDQGFSGDNIYLGDARGMIQINTDIPVNIERAVELACHEAYPGHHTHYTLLDARLVKERGWVEYSAFPFFGPLAFIAEGVANYAYTLAFPREQLLQFETQVLFPLAGLDPAAAPTVNALREATLDLAGARLTIGRMFLDGEIDRQRALELLQRYQLASPAFAQQILTFITRVRSYIINYGLGERAVRAYIEANGDDDDGRWQAMERLLSEPTLPADLEIER